MVVAGTLLTVLTAQERPPVFRVATDLVVVDLIATDREGRFVEDLRPENVQILEDGKPRKLQYLRLVRRGPGVDPATAVEPATNAATPPGTWPPNTADEEMRLGIVLDLGSMPPEALPRVRSAILDLLRDGLPAGVPVMIATVTPEATIHQSFTTDRTKLVAAVKALPVSLADQATFADVLAGVDVRCVSTNPVRIAEAAVAMGKQVIRETNRRVAATSRALSMVARSLAPHRGRKHIVLYSAGYALDPVAQVIDAVTSGVAACTSGDTMAVRRYAFQELGSLASSAATDGLRAAVDSANRSQASFYTIDPRGLMTNVIQPQQGGRSRTGGGGPLVRFATLDDRLSQDFLRALASDTGGRSFFNSNDIGAGLRRAWQDADSYYLIAYAPESRQKRGRFRRISLKIDRPGLDLRYRQGYFEVSDKDLADADIDNALRVPGAFVRDGFDVSTGIDAGTLRITVRLPPSAIRFTLSQGEYRADFSVHGELRTDRGTLVGGKPLDGRDVALRLTPERMQAMRSTGSVGVRLEAPLPQPGDYELAMVARDSGGWIAVRTTSVTVPR